MNNFSFKKAWSQVRQKDIEEVRTSVMDALGLTTKVAFYNRLNGDVEPKVSEAKAIEDIFNNYGITEIWGEDEYSDTSI